MKQSIFFIIILLTILDVARAQPIAKHQDRDFDVNKFNKDKADYVTLKAELSASEAAQFIPLMIELQHRRFELNREVRKQTRELEQKINATDAEYQHLLELSFDSDIKEAELKKEYYNKIRLILSPQKIYKCQMAESNFMKDFVNTRRQKRKGKNK